MASDDGKTAGRIKRTTPGSKRIKKAKANADNGLEGEDDGDAYLPPKMTRIILEQAREQRDEMDEEGDEEQAAPAKAGATRGAGTTGDQV